MKNKTSLLPYFRRIYKNYGSTHVIIIENYIIGCLISYYKTNVGLRVYNREIYNTILCQRYGKRNSKMFALAASHWLSLEKKRGVEMIQISTKYVVIYGFIS